MKPISRSAAHGPLRRRVAQWVCTFGLLLSAVASAEFYSVSVTPPPSAPTEVYQMGSAKRPDGATLTLDRLSLRLDGKRWTPVMGEFHYSRYPEREWREELLKLKAAGLDIVATYVFWIHHEEIEGQWDWSGRRNLRRFVELCRETGLQALVRCGPWCHGEVRNGGQPDWLLQKGWTLRSDDPRYLDKVRLLFDQIGAQLRGLLWKDGGPVLGIQFENEYGGPAQHLLNLKRLGRAAGLDVPLYTRTGWPELQTPMPFGEIIPLYGVYAEGFWDREITPMPGLYWSGFHFSRQRSDANIASEILGRQRSGDSAEAHRYPYLTCEIGGGMMNSYHRRILIQAADIESTTLVKLGSGSTSPGYYMVHGGENPEGRLTTLQESQATGYWNDLPVKNYDFQAPLGAYGQIRPHYHLLRRLHLFLKSWGSALAGMPVALPDQRPTGREDVETLRWAVRSDGTSGFVFVNNYERLRELPPKNAVQFGVRLPAGPLVFPETPVRIPGGCSFIWPFQMDLGQGIQLAWATAQPICFVGSDAERTVFFAATEDVPVEMAFNPGPKLSVRSGRTDRRSDRTVVRGIRPSTLPAVVISSAEGGRVQIVVLSKEDSLGLWMGFWQGRERAFLTKAGLVIDGPVIRLTSTDSPPWKLGVFPPPTSVLQGDQTLRGKADGVFQSFAPSISEEPAPAVVAELVRPAGPPRTIFAGRIQQPVAAAPEEADFAGAAVWRIRLPGYLDLESDPILRLHYCGDVARVILNGRLLTDDFYNGNALEIGLRRHAPDILHGDLRVAILPLRQDAPIYLAPEATPSFGDEGTTVELRRVEIVPSRQVELRAW